MDEFLRETPMSVMYWFFQRRESFLTQKRMPKWGRDHLDDYILLPAAEGYVTRDECFFVSHFWHSSDHPDPDGKYLRLQQQCLRQQPWSYIWVDWTCLPQHPRSPEEEAYFTRALQTMSAIIRNSGFSYFYPPFEPRLWILYEVAEYTLTAVDRLPETPDLKTFAEHVREMVRVGVRPTLERHGYRCTYDSDRDFLISWLELLVLLSKLLIDVSDIRRLLDLQTWSPTLISIWHPTVSGLVSIYRFEGLVDFAGERHKFTPFPHWFSPARGLDARWWSTSEAAKATTWKKFRIRHRDKGVIPDGALVLQERPDVAEKFLGVDLDPAIVVQAYNFFTPQPVRVAHIYLLHSILHGWHDEDAVRILSNVAGAMEKGYSRLLIHESLVSTIKSHRRVTMTDLVMMALFAAKERTEEEFKNLVVSAGLKVYKIWRPPHSVESIIEVEVA
ncbi:hypothetical protein PG989_010224 [Apiospora arundinis]